MMAQAVAEQNQASRRTETESDKEEERRPLEEIVVTGSRIKGVKDQFSRVTQFTREEMVLAGFSNVSDIFESLPQNFGGGVNIDDPTQVTGSGPGNASINLRGLGNQATLILLNGRRLPSGGAGGTFVDISTIPVSAIDRVDVLTDGASAIYGSDAIAGVVNIILRDDFEGAETRLNVGTITDGGGDYLKVGQTLGWSGERANAMVTYEYSEEGELDSNHKGFAAGAAEPTWLLPDTRKHSIFASTGARLTDRIKLSADGYFNERKSKQFTASDITSLNQAFTETDVQQYGGAIGLDVKLFADWEANLSGSYSKSDHFSDNFTAREEGTVPSSGELKSTVTEILSFDGMVGGSLFNISDNPARGVVGVHYRSEKADLLNVRTPAESISLDSDKSRDVFAAFGEVFVPVISDSNRIPGVQRLALSVAARYEEYDDVGSSIDPKVGFAWSPVTGLNVRATYGNSFRAPRMDQIANSVATATVGIFADPNAPDGESVALNITGNRDDLDPEQSRTWTAGFDFTPSVLEGLLLRGTYFNTEFRDQVGFPSRSFDQNFRFTNFTGTVVRDVSEETVQDFCARATIGCFNLSDFFPFLGDLTLEDVEVLLDQRLQNLSLSKVAGFDFEASYDLSSTIGGWRFTLAGTRLTTFEQQVAPATPVDDSLNTFGNPVKLKMRGGVQWRTTSMTTSIYINYTDDYIDDGVPSGDFRIDSFTTADASLRLDLDKLEASELTEGAFVTFSATNLLNEDPPHIGETPSRSSVFDAANSNPAGRKIGILLTKQF